MFGKHTVSLQVFFRGCGSGAYIINVDDVPFVLALSDFQKPIKKIAKLLPKHTNNEMCVASPSGKLWNQF